MIKTTFTPEQEQFHRLEMTRSYHEGLREGVSMYAHWRDGVQYVGTTGRTLKQAIDTINQEETDLLERYKRLAQL